MNTNAVSRRCAAAILAASALLLGACADSEEPAPPGTTTETETITSPTSAKPSPSTGESSKSPETSATEETESSGETADDDGAVTALEANGITFTLDGVGMSCWVGERAFLNCQGTAEWAPTSGIGPANTLSFDMNAETIQAMQANANMADLDLEDVDGGSRYEVNGVIFDLTESDRLTFTDELSGKSGYITADRYGWS
ncbi:hypothetical protein [Corynebacterium xerosis]|uniref:Lipoprotein n=1 Tax=Corynebacterium xerosis TaxID=1725 RepID=A0ABV3UR05_9CORY